MIVHTIDEDWGGIFWRGREDSLLGTSLSMGFTFLGVEEDTSALSDVVGTDSTPVACCRVGLVSESDELSVNLNATIGCLNGGLDLTCCKQRL